MSARLPTQRSQFGSETQRRHFRLDADGAVAAYDLSGGGEAKSFNREPDPVAEEEEDKPENEETESEDEESKEKPSG
jgi:hypothetical protein